MKKQVLGIAALVIMAVGCSTQKKVITVSEPVNLLTNDVDSMSYALGINFGANLDKNLGSIPGGKYNKEQIIKGFEQSLRGDSNLLIQQEEADAFFKKYIEKAQKSDVEKEKAEEEKFLAENKTKAGITTTTSGLQYLVEKEGTGVKPAATDTVVVNYVGTTIDGKEFDSSAKQGKPAEFPLNRVVPGWTEGIQLMSVGSKYKFFIPSDLAYGAQGIPQAGIKPYSPLIFEVELLEVKKGSAPKINLQPVTPNFNKAKK